MSENPSEISASAVNINTASRRELENLPHIGDKTAQKIIEFREEYGNFRRPQYILLVEGMSDKHFREIKKLIKVE